VATVIAAVLCEPLVGSVPFQPPDAVQLAAYVEVHCKVTEPPAATLVALEVRVTTGAGSVELPDGLVLAVSLVLIGASPHAASTANRPIIAAALVRPYRFNKLIARLHIHALAADH
jgi:hypothetical protein